MAAKITLEFDNETGPGFQKLIKSIEATEGASNELTMAGAQTNAMMQEMANQQMAISNAIENHTVATLGAAKQGFVQTTNAMFDFARNMKATANTVYEFGDAVQEKVIDHVQRRGAGAVILSLASAFGKVGPQVIAAKLALGGFNKLMDATGQRVTAVTGQVSDEVQHLVDAVNRGHMTVQQLQEETGASLDELGLKAETNYTRYSDAVSKMAGSVKDDLGSIGGRMAETVFLWPGAIDDAKNAWDELDKRLTDFADNAEENAELIRDAFDKIMGRDSDQRREQEKLAEKNALEEPMRKRIREFEKGLEEQAKLERELHDISRLESQKDVEAALQAERQKREAMVGTVAYRGELEKASKARIEALVKQGEAIRMEGIRRREAEEQKVDESRRKAMKEHQALIRKQLVEETQLREEAARRQQEIRETYHQERRSLLTQEKLQVIEAAKVRQEIIGDREDKILLLEREAARVRAQELEANAKTEEDIIRAQMGLQRELRDLDFQHEMNMRRKKAAAAEEAAKKELEVERQKIDAMKGLRDDQGRNLLEHVAGKQSPEAVLQELTRRRLAESRQQDPNLGRDQRLRMDRSIRQQTAQQFRAGQIPSDQVGRVQMDLASRQILLARSQGKVSDLVVKTLSEQARVSSNQMEINQHVEEQLAGINQHLQGVQSAQRGQQGRLRSQRAGMR